MDGRDFARFEWRWAPDGHLMLQQLQAHYDVMTWKRFLHYWPFVRGIHRWPVDSHHKGPVMRSFGVSFNVSLNKLLNKQSRGRWIEKSWLSFDVTVMCSITPDWCWYQANTEGMGSIPAQVLLWPSWISDMIQGSAEIIRLPCLQFFPYNYEILCLAILSSWRKIS